MNPTATTCMATSFEMPRKEQAIGIRNSEPPAIPLAPQAPILAIMQSIRAVGKLTETPSVLAAAKVMMAIVMVVIIAVLFIVEDWFGKDVEG